MAEKWVNTLFPAKLEKQARVLAAEMGVSPSEFVRQATAEYVAKVEKQIQSEDGRVKEGAHEQHA